MSAEQNRDHQRAEGARARRGAERDGATGAADSSVLLRVSNLKSWFFTRSGIARAVDGVSFELRRGETLGIVGESGSGKSVTCLSIARMLPKPAGRIVEGEIEFDGVDLLKLSNRAMRDIRGARIAYVTQDPLASLDPLFRVGDQVGEPMRDHGRVGRGGTRAKVAELLQHVRIPAAAARARQYPHEMSGGMRQRVVLALALGCEPELLIADEPTTALDVTVQAQILELLRSIQQESGLSMIVVTHDFGIVTRICDRVAVMYAGRIVEEAPVADIFENPLHPYTRGLIASMPRGHERPRRMPSIDGQPPDVRALPAGCSFAPRCTYKKARCESEYPPSERFGGAHRVSCWAASELQGVAVAEA